MGWLRKILLSLLIALSIFSFILLIGLVMTMGSSITVTFVYSSDHSISVYEAKRNDPVDLSQVKAKPGYQVLGFYLDPDFLVVLTPEFKLSKDTLVFVSMDFHTYSITYHNVLGLTNPNPTSFNVTTNTFILSPVFRDTYIFEGWYSDSLFTHRVVSVDKGTTGNLVFYANFLYVGVTDYLTEVFFENEYGVFEFVLSRYGDASSASLPIGSIFSSFYNYYILSNIVVVGPKHCKLFYTLLQHEVKIIDSTNGAVLSSHFIRHGSTLTLPTIIEIDGYKNSHYTHDGKNIISDCVIYIQREAKDDTPYTIMNYLVAQDGSMTLSDKFSFIGTTGTLVTIPYNTYIGYQAEGDYAHFIITYDCIICLYYYEVV